MVAAAVGLIVGIGIGVPAGYLVFKTDERVGESAAADVEVACRLAAQIADSHTGEDDWGALDEDPAHFHLYAVGGLLSAAALQDDQYDDLAEAGRDAWNAGMRAQFDELSGKIRSVADACTNP